MQKISSKRDVVSVDTIKAIWELGGIAPVLYRDTRQAVSALSPSEGKYSTPLNRKVGET